MPKTNASVESEPVKSMQTEAPPPQQNIEWLSAQEAAEHLRNQNANPSAVDAARKN